MRLGTWFKTALFLGSAVLSVSAFTSSARAAVQVIDAFSDKNTGVWPMTRTTSGVGSVGDTEGTGATGRPALTAVLGSVRRSAITATALDIAGLDQASLNVFNTGGFSVLDYQSSAGAKSGFEEAYGVPAGLTTAQAYDLDITPYNAVELNLAAYDAPATGSMTIQAFLYSGTTAVALPIKTITTGGAQTIDILIPDAIRNTMTHNDGIDLLFDVPKGGDVRVDTVQFTQVPEPASLGAVAMVGCLFWRRGRRPH